MSYNSKIFKITNLILILSFFLATSCGIYKPVDARKVPPNVHDRVKKNIEDRLNPEFEGQFKVMLVPNITNICYGRGVGYKIEEIELSKEIQEISATKIRAKMREEGKLK